MATLKQHSRAASDPHIRTRLKDAAEQLGIQNAEAWVNQNIGLLVSMTVSGDQTVADILAYKDANYTRQHEPGEDPAAATDDHLRETVRKTIAATNSVAIPTAPEVDPEV